PPGKPGRLPRESVDAGHPPDPLCHPSRPAEPGPGGDHRAQHATGAGRQRRERAGQPRLPGASARLSPTKWPTRTARARLIPATATALVLKDWRLRRRDLSQLTRVLMPMAFLGLFLLLRSRPLFDLVHSVGRGPLAALIALAPAWLLLIALTSTLGLSAVSLEGKAVWVYLASPNSTRELLSAKCWS